MNNQRKAIVAVLGVALFALVIDRVIIGDSGPQSASAQPQSAAIPAAVTPASTATTTLAAGQIILASRLQQIQEMEQFELNAVPNGFAPATSWIKPKPKEEVKNGNKVGVNGSSFDPVVQFIKEHPLTAVLGSDEGGTAIVDGKPWNVGQTLKGWKLTTITIRTAVFEKDGKTAVLQIAPPKTSK